MSCAGGGCRLLAPLAKVPLGLDPVTALMDVGLLFNPRVSKEVLSLHEGDGGGGV